jgi:FAD/FMN-containing dehydrogenase
MRWRPSQRPDRREPFFRPGTLRRGVTRALRVALTLLVAIPVLAIAAGGWAARSIRVERPAPPPTVNDVTQLNPIAVSRVVTPTSIEEIVAAIRDHDGPVSIGGGRFSMGGQTATEGALQLDLRRFNRILAFDPAHRVFTVQAGTRWRQIQERVDRAGLSVKIMQTYADFTVGGALSVNAHGRYVGLGPVILSVRAVKVVLADGTLVEASPTVNAEIFYGVIGGHGGGGAWDPSSSLGNLCTRRSSGSLRARQGCPFRSGARSRAGLP